MIKINGKTYLELDEIGDTPRGGSKQIVCSACDRFLASRGLPIHLNESWRAYPDKVVPRRKKP